jgi:hypothetical protein
MAITIESVTPPTKGRGRPKRLSAEHIDAMLAKVVAGEFASDSESSKKSAASQRGRAARADIYEAGYTGQLMVKTWNTTGSKDDNDPNWRWAVGPR